MFKNRTVFQSFKYSFEGLFHAVKENKNMRIHILIGVFVLTTGLVLGVNSFEMAIMGVMILLVIMAEMINTAIEEMVDLIITEHHRQAKIAKDVASGMVLVAVIGSIIVGIFIFVPRILRIFGLHQF